MKPKISQHIYILLFTVFLSFSCTTQSKNGINKCNSNLKKTDTLRNSRTSKDSIVFDGQIYKYIKFFNLKTGKYTVKDKNNTVLLSDVKYFSQVNGGFQALNNACEIVYYNLDLEKLTKEPKPEMLGFCGNVPNWKVKIEETEDYYTIKKLEGHSGNYSDVWQKKDSIPKLDIKDIYFLNKKKNIQFDGNFYFPETIIIVYENSFGIRTNNNIFIFDAVDISTDYIKVTCNGLYGYFETTEIKYKKLGSFEYNLAQFELDNGQKGYVDTLGNEYFK